MVVVVVVVVVVSVGDVEADPQNDVFNNANKPGQLGNSRLPTFFGTHHTRLSPVGNP